MLYTCPVSKVFPTTSRQHVRTGMTRRSRESTAPHWVVHRSISHTPRHFTGSPRRQHRTEEIYDETSGYIFHDLFTTQTCYLPIGEYHPAHSFSINPLCNDPYKALPRSNLFSPTTTLNGEKKKLTECISTPLVFCFATWFREK